MNSSFLYHYLYFFQLQKSKKVLRVVLYIVPYYLKQREIQAAQADLALLSIQSAPSPSLKNGIDALWLLEFRTKDDAERADLMKRFGSDIRYHQDTFKQN